MKITTPIFIERAKIIHKDFYKYNLYDFKNYITKSTITCPIHGNFQQNPKNHLQGRGCKLCARGKLSLILSKKLSSNKEDFKDKSNIIHNFKFDYSLVEYKNAKTKVNILCRIHGNFEQTPSSHLSGKGCMKCKDEGSIGYRKSSFIKICNNNMAYLYVIRCFNESEEFYKVGITKNSVKERYKCAKSMPYEYEVVKIITSTPSKIWDLEKRFISVYKKCKYKPSIKFGGHTECFNKKKNP